MTDSHEPSYYEIALTNRQVLVAFVVVLLCVLAAFLGGVWLGRDGLAADDGVEPETELAAGTVPEDADGLDEFKFFSERDGDAPAAAEPPPPARERPAARGDVDRPLAEDVGSAAPGSLTTPPPPRPPPPPPPPPPQTSPPPPPPPPQRQTSPPPAAAGETGFVVQVFSTDNERRAREIVARLRKGNENAFLSPVEVGGRTMYRVRIGPFSDRPAAETVKTRIERHYQDLPKPWVTDARN